MLRSHYYVLIEGDSLFHSFSELREIGEEELDAIQEGAAPVGYKIEDSESRLSIVVSLFECERALAQDTLDKISALYQHLREYEKVSFYSFWGSVGLSPDIDFKPREIWVSRI